MEILYIDASTSKSIARALSRYGTVHSAVDVNEAFRLLVENEIDYYFIDADVPNALPFLRHIRHDPSIVPIKGYVLLTNNMEEDCQAWGVDFYVHKQRLKLEIPYIFSHLRESAGPIAKVSSISDDFDPYGESEHADLISISPQGRSFQGKESPYGKAGTWRNRWQRGSDRGGLRRAFTIITFCLIFIATVGAAVIIWSGKEEPGVSGINSQDVSTDKKQESADEYSDGKPADKKSGGLKESSAILRLLEEVVTGEEQVDAGYSEKDIGSVPSLVNWPGNGSVSEPVPSQENTQPEHEPPPVQLQEEPGSSEPPPPNRNPTVSISGPTTVQRGHTAYYQASASDPDGDPLTYSWSGVAGSGSTAGKSFPSPGQFGVNVTVSDGRGGTATTGLIMNVI